MSSNWLNDFQVSCSEYERDCLNRVRKVECLCKRLEILVEESLRKSAQSLKSLEFVNDLLCSVNESKFQNCSKENYIPLEYSIQQESVDNLMQLSKLSTHKHEIDSKAAEVLVKEVEDSTLVMLPTLHEIVSGITQFKEQGIINTKKASLVLEVKQFDVA